MTTITFEEDIKITKTNFKNFNDFKDYIINNNYTFEIPELKFTEYDKLNDNDKLLFDNINLLDRNKFTNI